jgi:ferredoxin--NADP+ reductase
MRAAGQNPDEAKAFILSALPNAEEPVSDTRFSFQFLASPARLVAGDNGGVRAIEVEDTTLVAQEGGEPKAVGLKTFREIPADTVVFCIGDRVDAGLGLPLDKWGDFAKNPQARFAIDEVSYEAYNPELQQPLEGVFLAGWARQASTGLVGAARKDGTNAAQAVLAFLSEKPAPGADALAALRAKAAGFSAPLVSNADLDKLEEVEASEAAKQGLPEFKFDTNEEMLAAMGKLQREKS